MDNGAVAIDPRLPAARACVLPYLVERYANESPERVFAAFEDGGEWRWGDVHRDLRVMAGGLRRLGLQREARLIVWMPNGRRALSAMFAANYLGAVSVAINTAYRGGLLEHVLTNAGAEIAFVHPDLIERLLEIPTRGPIATIVSSADAVARHGAACAAAGLRLLPFSALDGPVPNDVPVADLQPWTTQSIVYTSGTTGPSKGVLSSYVHLSTMGIETMPQLTASDRYMINLPLFHAGATLAIAAAVARGGSIAVIDAFKTTTFLATCKTLGATTTILLGVMASFLLREPPSPADRDHPLRLAMLVPLGEDAAVLEERFGFDVVTTFNMSETSGPIRSGLNPSGRRRRAERARRGRRALGARAQAGRRGAARGRDRVLASAHAGVHGAALHPVRRRAAEDADGEGAEARPARGGHRGRRLGPRGGRDRDQSRSAAVPGLNMMEIDASYVGRIVGETDVAVTFRDSAAYAAAIGAESEPYLDDRTEGGARVPPWFVATYEWPLVSGPPALERYGVPRSELFRTVLHAYQDTRFERPIRVGDRLHVEAVLASVRQAGSGVLAAVRIATTDAASQRSVAESWFGAFFRHATVNEPRTAFETPESTFSTSQTFATIDEMTITRGQSHVYSECSRLWNPIHTERISAAAAGLPDIAVHGTFVWARAGLVFVDRFLGGDPSRLRRQFCRFRKPVHPGRPLLVRSARIDASPTLAALEVCAGDDVVAAGFVETDRAR